MAISLAESLHIGFSDIWTRKVRSIVTIVGIILGVMSIMVVLAIVNGMNQSTMQWMQERGGLTRIDVQRNWLYDFRKGGVAEFSLKEIKLIRERLPEVEAFNPKVSAGNLELKHRDRNYSSDVQGIMPDMVLVDNWQPEKGRFIKDIDLEENNNVVVLGSTVARELFGSRNPLGQQVGILMETMQMDSDGEYQPRLETHQMTVIGVMTRKYMKMNGGDGPWGDNPLEYRNRQVFIPISTLVNKLNPKLQISELEIKAKDVDSATEIRKKLDEIILNLKQGKKLFMVVSANEQMQQMKSSGMIFSAIFIMIAVISLLVGGIVIMNIMLASIKERTKEIGVRLAIGARRRDIFTQFLVQTVMITGLGGVFGILAGYAILDVVEGFLEITVSASLQMVWVALLVSVGVGLVFGIMPAVRASNLDPVIALREE